MYRTYIRKRSCTSRMVARLKSWSLVVFFFFLQVGTTATIYTNSHVPYNIIIHRDHGHNFPRHATVSCCYRETFIIINRRKTSRHTHTHTHTGTRVQDVCMRERGEINHGRACGDLHRRSIRRSARIL